MNVAEQRMLRSNESLRGMLPSNECPADECFANASGECLRAEYNNEVLTTQLPQLRSQIILLHKIAMMNAMTNNHEADGASGVRGVVRHGLELKHFRRHVFE